MTRLSAATTFLLPAVAFGVPAGYVFTSSVTRDGADIATVAALAGVAFAIPLLALLTRSQRRLGPSVLASIPIALVASLTGAVIALLLFFGSQRLPLGSWLRLPDPPEAPSSFLGPTCAQDYVPSLFVATDGGVYSYGYRISGERSWAMEPKVPSLSPDPDIVGRCTSETEKAPPSPRLHSAEIDNHRVQEIGADCGGTSFYVLLEDGSIWTWGTGWCAMAVFFLFLVPAWGALVGLLTSLVFMVLRAKEPVSAGA